MDLERKGFQKGLIVFGILLGILVLLGTLISFFVIEVVEKDSANDVSVSEELPPIEFLQQEDKNVQITEGDSYTFDLIFKYPSSNSITALQYDLDFEGGIITNAVVQNLNFYFGFCSDTENLAPDELPGIYKNNKFCLVGASNDPLAQDTVIARVTVDYANPGTYNIKTGTDNNLYDTDTQNIISTVSGINIGTVQVAAQPYCGDGIVNDGEVCDTGNFNGVECSPEYGQTCSYCSSDCKQEIQVPVQAFCGDSQVNGNEECDDGNNVNNDMCSNECIAPVCGDSIKNGNEECDDGNSIDDDSCSNACTIVETTIDPVCGNGVVEEGEECDNPQDQTCNPTTCQLNPVNTKTCYRCTVSETDGNNCEAIDITTYDGSTPVCPSGSTENSNCAEASGGSCPVSSNPGDTAVACGPLDVNSDNQLTLTDFVSFVQYFGKTCSDTRVLADATTCGSKDQKDPSGAVGLTDLVYFASKFNKGANSCLAQ